MFVCLFACLIVCLVGCFFVCVIYWTFCFWNMSEVQFIGVECLPSNARYIIGCHKSGNTRKTLPKK